MVESNEIREELARPKELKVQIPMELYLKLHQHKILHGALLSEVVSDALQSYLEEELTAPAESTDETTEQP